MKTLFLLTVCFLLAHLCAPRGNAQALAHAQPPDSSSPGAPDRDALLAPTPPMGWNSWDSYGATINEGDFKANAGWFAEHLRPYGWQYVTVDMEWFVSNPVPEGNGKASTYSFDTYGRYIPALNRFPSSANGAGFKALADYVHSLGLKFGIHILRGVPKSAVEKKLPIEGSPYTADSAADPADTCPWNPDNYGTNPSHPAAQAYYDSIARLYAQWTVDLIKVDCISSRPYKGDDIRMLRLALNKTGRSIALSLSPGAAPLDKTAEMRKYAEQWRISDDIWDLWHSDVAYPQGLGDQFPRAAEWAALVQAGHWPDADMLPIGYLGPAPGWGQARQTRLTHDEQRTLLTLWCIFRSPLMIGANLTVMDPWTTSLLTNREVLAVDQASADNRQLFATGKVVVWMARPEGGRGYYLAVFNLDEAEQKVEYGWKDLGLAESSYSLRDLWEHKDLGSSPALSLSLAPHGAALFRVAAGPPH